MTNLKVIVAKSTIYAGLLGALVALILYILSTWFFDAKNKQTLIQSTDLDHSSGGEVVFPVGIKLPEIEFKGLFSGQRYVLNADPAQVRVVNFWASWCEPCVEEFSSFARLIRKFEGKVSFVGINEDKTVEEAEEFLKAFAVDFKGLSGVYFGFDEGKQLFEQYGILALPESFLIDSKGQLIRRVSGFEKWDSQGAIGYFQMLIEKYGDGK